jgi:glycosyltransferase involved in cell wall biosynthesis
MKVLFLTLSKINSIEEQSIYQDLLRKFKDEGHYIYIVSPLERRYNRKTNLIYEDKVTILNVWTPNIQKTNIIEKGFGTLILEFIFKKAINKFYKNEKFDLIIYSTPPITFTRLVKSLKKENNAKTYLLLKDIFPQNAVDLKMMSPSGILYNYFRKREIELYMMSDWIGCMSNENKKYILKHNPYIDEKKVEVNPNSIYLKEVNSSNYIQSELLSKIPKGKIIFLYGGNLGKPQGIDFLLDVIVDAKNNSKAFFIIVGSGTETKRIIEWFNVNKPENALFINELNQNDYDIVLQNCHVGLVFLNPNFTIPNYPSRILSYMKNKLPILFATDLNSDVGKEAELYEYGLWCENGDIANFRKFIDFFINEDHKRISMGNNGFNRLKADFSVDFSYKVIMKHFEKNILMN